MTYTRTLFTLLCLMLGWFAVSPLPVGAVSTKPPPTVVITPPTKALVGLPILLPVQIINHSDEAIRLTNVGDYGRRWVRLVLFDGEGKQIGTEPLPDENRGIALPVFTSPGVPKAVITSIASVPLPPIPPQGTLEGTIVTAKHLIVSAPGNYTLRAYVHLEYATGQGQRIVRELRTKLTLPLTVTASDDDFQHETTEELYRIATSNDVLSQRDGIAGLFSLPETLGALYWHLLAANRNLKPQMQTVVQDELAHSETKTAVDILLQSWNGQTGNAIDAYPLSLLRYLYHRTQSPTLKAYIEKEIGNREGGNSLLE